jgi:4-aminobutyrate aminotransferase-like enzyme
MDSESIRHKHKQYLFPAAKNFYNNPVVVTEGKNACVKDLEGNSYLDFFGGILTVSIGHCNDEVNNAVKEQIDKLVHISSLYPVVPVVELAEKLANITPGRLEKCYFTASGTEADETAVSD